MNDRDSSLGESRPARVIAWLAKRRWSRIDGLVILGLGWLMGSDHRIGSRIAILITVMFGVSFAGDLVLAVAARILGRREPDRAGKSAGAPHPRRRDLAA